MFITCFIGFILIYIFNDINDGTVILYSLVALLSSIGKQL